MPASLIVDGERIYDMTQSGGSIKQCILNENSLGGLMVNVDNPNPSVGTPQDGPFFPEGTQFNLPSIADAFDANYYESWVHTSGPLSLLYPVSVGVPVLERPFFLSDEALFDHFMTIGVCYGAPLNSNYNQIIYSAYNYDVYLDSETDLLANRIADEIFGITPHFGSPSVHYTAYGRIEGDNGDIGNTVHYNNDDVTDMRTFIHNNIPNPDRGALNTHLVDPVGNLLDLQAATRAAIIAFQDQYQDQYDSIAQDLKDSINLLGLDDTPFFVIN